MDDSIWKLIILFVCLVLSSFFSASETALMSLNKVRLRQMREEQKKGAEQISSLLEDPSRMLSTVLVANNVVNVLASVLVTSLVISVFNADFGVAVATGAAALLILVFGEIVPKSLAIKNAEKISLFCIRPLTLVSILLTPLVFILNKITSVLVLLFGGKDTDQLPTITEQELITMVNMGHEEGVIKVEEKEMLHNVFEFGDGEIREIMTPRILVISVNDDDDYDTIISVFKEYTYSRLPVNKNDSDEIIGILHIKDIAFADVNKAEFAVSNYIRAPHFVYEFNNISRVFNEMRKNGIQMAIVLDEYGVMAGIVTNEDFIEEIVGDITDEYDDDEDAPKEVGENEYIVDGALGIDNLNSSLGIDIESDDFESIGGFVLGKLGEFPEVGDKITHENIELTVESITNNRIESLRVVITQTTDDNNGSTDNENKNTGNDATVHTVHTG